MLEKRRRKELRTPAHRAPGAATGHPRATSHVRRVASGPRKRADRGDTRGARLVTRADARRRLRTGGAVLSPAGLRRRPARARTRSLRRYSRTGDAERPARRFRAATSTAVAQCRSHERTPSGVPVANAPALPRYSGSRARCPSSVSEHAPRVEPARYQRQPGRGPRHHPVRPGEGRSASSSPCTTAARTSAGAGLCATTAQQQVEPVHRAPQRPSRASRSGTIPRAASRCSRASTWRGARRHRGARAGSSRAHPQRSLHHRVGDRAGAYLRQVVALPLERGAGHRRRAGLTSAATGPPAGAAPCRSAASHRRPGTRASRGRDVSGEVVSGRPADRRAASSHGRPSADRQASTCEESSTDVPHERDHLANLLQEIPPVLPAGGAGRGRQRHR